ncbi:MAG TPA: hypothetical protein VGY98_14850 [Verrucomicrobiae bacterium]|nr:hypothetical protein [Verrucomicrobiae bacterium]
MNRMDLRFRSGSATGLPFLIYDLRFTIYEGERVAGVEGGMDGTAAKEVWAAVVAVAAPPAFTWPSTTAPTFFIDDLQFTQEEIVGLLA